MICHCHFPISQEEEYQEKKRFLSEEFFNMRISHTRNVWMEKTSATRGDEVENIGKAFRSDTIS